MSWDFPEQTTWHKAWCAHHGITADQALFERVRSSPLKSQPLSPAMFNRLVDHLVFTNKLIIPNGRGINLGNGEEVYPE